MFRRGLVAMTGRLMLSVAFVANILVLLAYTETSQATATSVSSASGTSSSSYAWSSSLAKTAGKSKRKCRKARRCPNNEEFSFCPESIQYCSEKAEPSTYRSSKPCAKGCVCKKDYLRAENGTCIPAAQCPVTCGVNEILDNCPTNCQSDFCPTEEDTEVKSCVIPDVCPPPACKCAFNHRRAPNGSCIPTKECPAYACGTNEEYNPCPPLCPTDDCSQASPSGECPPHFGRIGIVLPCNPKCRCIKDYWRLDGICVPYGQCPGVCPDNERYSTCTQAECRALNCTQKDKPVPCIDIDPQFCNKGCVCKKGYLRNSDGICVLEDKCEPGAQTCPANERYSTCTQAECRALNCTQKGQPVPCIRLDPQYCKKGCVCEEGYLRNDDGICVLEDKCEPAASCTSANEEFVPCMQGVCRAKDCSQKGEDVPCPDIPQDKCDSGCICKENFLRAANGSCVPEDQCEPNKCPLFEVWDDCANAVCRAEYCTQKGLPVPCPSVTKCLPGCLCRPGYLRNADGFCVPEEDCNTNSCPINEEWSTCAQATCRAQNCSQKGGPIFCPMIAEGYCEKACVCKENYLRNENGDCVPEDQCPPKTCGKNEVLDNCSLSCNSDNCPQSADEEHFCTQSDPCIPACKCKFNYRRSENGTCIPTRDCPPFDCSAKPNEEYVACPPFCPSDECGKPRLEGRCPFVIGTFLQCNPKCQCKDGYGRVNGTCVPFDKCPGLCPTNEVYSPCVQKTCRQNCSDRDVAMKSCPSIDKPSCQRGCVCQENYYRNATGVCVPYDECEGPVTCGVNEILDNCPTNCQPDYCPTEEDTEVKSCVMPDVCPPPVCLCAFNHRRAANGSCIPTKECPAYACGTNEEYNPCPPLCPTDDCSQASPSGECPPHFGRIGIVLPCNPKCRCIKDYWRLDGICVPYGQCPGVCPDNERYSTCTQAECRALNCTQKDKPVPCIDIDPQFCNKGCVCKEGYLRNSDGICVLKDKCEPGAPPTCPANERYSTCTQAECRALNCTQKGKPVACIRLDPQFCKKGCVCKEGYLRNEHGICVLEDRCKRPITCGANEILDNCPTNCQSDYCPTKEDTETTKCVRPAVCPPPACKCAFNHRRAPNGSCIPTIECPAYACGTNEEYNPCPPLCPTDDCSQASPSGKCPPRFGRIGIVLPCSPKCRCIENYWRLDGICVPYGQCPGICPANERYSTCTQAECRALNCTQKGQPVPCVRLDPQYCKEGCVCEEGYLRNDDGICVLEDKCEPAASCTSANEEFVPCMQGVCRAKDCSQKGEDVPCPDIPQEKCDSGCICKEHFLRAANGSCVPEDQCEPNLCQPNEEFSYCIQAICSTLNCSHKGNPRACPMVIENDCKKGCVCQEGYLRTEDGCIPEDKCNPNKCPLFEVWDDCANAVCRAEYCTQKGLPVPCPLVTKCLPGCLCRPGYLRNADGFCVPEEDCNTNSCPINEEWSTCAQATCRAQNCSQKGGPIFCPMIAEGYCEKACVCKENYLRTENGDCVPEDQCPPKTCGKNEVLDNCSLSCNSDNCPQSADEEHFCTQSDPCIPACKCKFNYRRSENGTCIPTRDCPPFDCSAKPNEEYVACPPFCPSDECGKPRLEGRCPFVIGTFLQCNPKCQCKDGYGRVNGTCVPFDKCPGLCPTNEVYSPCVQKTCRQNCSDRDVAMKSCPSIDESSCQRGCVCQENYYRNATGVCVPYDECEAPKTCGANEVLDKCPMICNTDNCPRSADEKQVCTKADPCVPACKCRFNFRRAKNGTCIPTRDCPPFDCSAKPNEKFVACPPLCPTDACGRPRLEGRCPFRIGILLYCNPKCQCKDGYGRLNGTCVPFEKCPDLCPTNEVYSPCVQQTCRQQKCSDRDLVMESCPSCDKASCKRGCVCQENYYRNDKGVCVSYEQCGGPMCPNAHEEYTPNFKECPPNTCHALVERITCDENQKEGPGCVCSSGYLRINVTSPCIPICDCPEMKYSADC